MIAHSAKDEGEDGALQVNRPRFSIGRFLIAQTVVAFFLGVVSTIAVPTWESIVLALILAILPTGVVLLSSTASGAFKTLAAYAVGALIGLELLAVLFVVVFMAAVDPEFLLVMTAGVFLTVLGFLVYATWFRPRPIVEVRFLDEPPLRR